MAYQVVHDLGHQFLDAGAAVVDGHVRVWFDGQTEQAAARMQSLADDFAALGDALGQIDNWINLGRLRLAGDDRDIAGDLLRRGYNASVHQAYPVGAALAAEGLRRLGDPIRVRETDLAFYHPYLARLFDRCPSPFVPCYLLLLP